MEHSARFGEATFNLFGFCGSLRQWKEPTVIFCEVHRVPKAHCRALTSNLRSDAPKDKVQEFASKSTRGSCVVNWAQRCQHGHLV